MVKEKDRKKQLKSPHGVPERKPKPAIVIVPSIEEGMLDGKGGFRPLHGVELIVNEGFYALLRQQLKVGGYVQPAEQHKD